MIRPMPIMTAHVCRNFSYTLFANFVRCCCLASSSKKLPRVHHCLSPSLPDNSFYRALALLSAAVGIYCLGSVCLSVWHSLSSAWNRFKFTTICMNATRVCLPDNARLWLRDFLITVTKPNGIVLKINTILTYNCSAKATNMLIVVLKFFIADCRRLLAFNIGQTYRPYNDYQLKLFVPGTNDARKSRIGYITWKRYVHTCLIVQVFTCKVRWCCNIGLSVTIPALYIDLPHTYAIVATVIDRTGDRLARWADSDELLWNIR